MGMQAYLKRVPPTIFAQCTEDAEFAKDYIAGNQAETETICLKESWDGLHYLLSHKRRRPAKELDTMIVWDTSDLLAVSILGKEVLNPKCKFGFGVPKWVDENQVTDIKDLLDEIDWEVLRDDIVPEKMIRCGVYPEGLWDDEAKSVKYLQYWLERLKKFYQVAASKNQAVIAYLKL